MVDFDELARNIQGVYTPVKKAEPVKPVPVLKKEYGVGGSRRKYT